MLERADFSAVIFDMDGLVLDTESTYRFAWAKAAKGMGYDVSESFLRALSGLPSAEVLSAIETYCGSGFDLTEFNCLSGQIWRNHVSLHGIEVKRGFMSLLDYLIREHIPYCLATNSRMANACECLELAGLMNVFSIMICRDQVRQGKPAPDLFLTAAERLRMPIERCLVLEDSIIGIEAATRAGAIPVLIAPARPKHLSTPDFRSLQVNDLAELLELIRDNIFRSDL